MPHDTLEYDDAPVFHHTLTQETYYTHTNMDIMVHQCVEMFLGVDKPYVQTYL